MVGNATALRIVVLGVVIRVVLAKRERRGSGRAAVAKVIVKPNGRTAAGRAGPGVETIFAGLGFVEEGLRRSSLVGRVRLGQTTGGLIHEASKLGLKLTHLFFKDVDVLGAGRAAGFVVAEAAGWTRWRGGRLWDDRGPDR